MSAQMTLTENGAVLDPKIHSVLTKTRNDLKPSETT